MRVVVTGSAGFIAGHLIPELEAAGHEVHGFDRRDGDLTEPGTASYLIQRNSPDLVVHLAGQVGRQFGEADRAFTIRSNAVMTAHVAYETQRIGARLVLASSSEIYGDQGDDDVYETTLPKLPYNLYGLTKRWSEEVAQLYCDNLAVARLAMPYGPGLPAGKGRAAIINFLDAAHHNQPITVHRDSERCWCWIGDTVRGIRLIAESPETGAFNVGRDDACRSMLEVAYIAKQITRSTSAIEMIEPPSNQVLVKRLRTDRLRSLGWRPTIELRPGMELTYRSMLETGMLTERSVG